MKKLYHVELKKKKITNLINIKKQNYKLIKDMLINNFLINIQK